VSAAATETITFARDDVRELALDVEAIATYVFDVVNVSELPSQGLELAALARMNTAYERLLDALGVHDDFDRDGWDSEGYDRGREWLAVDRENLAYAFGHHLTGALGRGREA